MHVPSETRGIPAKDSDRSAPQGGIPLYLDVPTLLFLREERSHSMSIVDGDCEGTFYT